MIGWDWPWLLLALPLPWLLRRSLPAADVGRSGAALRLPFYDEAVRLAGDTAGRGGRWRVPALLAWLLLCLAAARPQWIGEIEAPPRTGRDLLLAVDVSGSMAAEDMVVGGRPVDRFTAVQLVIGDFLGRRSGDRVGLLLFGSQAYLVTPLTFDRESVRYQLQTSTIGLAGRETAIGDAIGIAVKRLRDQPAAQRVLILLTDGVSNAGALKPLEAARLAHSEGLRIYTVGVGGDGRRAGMLGLMLPAAADEIDEPTMTRIAEMTGGRYFRARSAQELAAIYAELDRLEPAAQAGETLRPRHELYPWPLAAAVLLILSWLLWRTRPWQREPIG
jgi:Ca-activated chloride channel homolog